MASPPAADLIQLGTPIRPVGPIALSPEERQRYERRARLLAWGGIAWHFVEFLLAIAAGVLAGLDRPDRLRRRQPDRGRRRLRRRVAVHRQPDRIEPRRAAGPAVDRCQLLRARRLRRRRVGAHARERRPAAGELVRDRPRGVHGTDDAAARPREAPCRHEARLLRRRQGGSQTSLCAYLSVALLVGLGANALLGWWWADPLAALVIAAVALKEGRESWRGEGCAAGCC